MFRFFVALALFFVSVSGAQADTLADALDAHRRGDEKTAIDMLIPLAEGGNVTAMNTLSHIYWWGDGTQPDHAEALRWTRRSAARGSSVGQNDLAVHYGNGDGVTKDRQIAAALFRMSADQGEAFAQGSLAAMYLTGDGVPLDIEAGIALLRTAAAQGYSKAQRQLGGMAWQGAFGVAQDVREAVRLFELAAEQRDVESQLMLGFLYVGDRSGPDGLPRAATWLTVAARAGCSQAAGMVAALVDDMTSDELRAALERASDWEAAHPIDRHRHASLPDVCFIGPREGA